MKILDALLVIAIVVGSVMLIRGRSELSLLGKDLERVNAAVGDMVVEDETKLYAQALKNEDPWQWAWRIYLPDKSSGTIRHTSGGGSGSHGFDNNKEMFIARCSIGQTRSGAVGIYFRFAGGSSFSSFGTAEFFAYLKANAHRLNIQQFGSDEAETLSPGSQPVMFLKISMPEDMAAEAKERFKDEPNVSRLIPDLMEVTLDLN